jgi:hypothetical protein
VWSRHKHPLSKTRDTPPAGQRYPVAKVCIRRLPTLERSPFLGGHPACPWPFPRPRALRSSYHAQPAQHNMVLPTGQNMFGPCPWPSVGLTYCQERDVQSSCCKSCWCRGICHHTCHSFLFGGLFLIRSKRLSMTLTAVWSIASWPHSKGKVSAGTGNVAPGEQRLRWYSGVEGPSGQPH